MKKITLSVLGLFVCIILLGSIIVSCEKESQTKIVQNSIENIDFDRYFSKVENFEIEFWSACDNAYNSDSELFMAACNSNDFEKFKEITNLSSEFFESFTNEIMNAQAKIEKDYPGICDKYRESPCEECSQKALQRVGSYVNDNMGNSAEQVLKLGTRDCIFICSLGCMTTMELYIPCVLTCTRLCTLLSSIEN